MFQISEYNEEDIFSTEEKVPQDSMLTWQDSPTGVTTLDSPVNRESPSLENPEVRGRIGSDPPPTDSEVPDEVGTFRARSRSAPPILWAAQRYGRELRRMSDEFHGALQKLPRPKSAGTAVQMHQTLGWKETLQSWWSQRSPNDGPPRNPP